MNCENLRHEIKDCRNRPLLFYHFPIKFLPLCQYTNRQYSILSRKLIYKHENSEPFPCLYHIPHISTAFSVKLVCLSAKTANILLLFTFPFYTITETTDFCVKVYFCLIVRFFPLSPSYQRHQKRKKARSTTHCDEPHQALKPLILSHSSILSPVSTKNPMALFLNSCLCRCYTLMTFTPLTPFTPTQFDIRQNPYLSVLRNCIRAALKAVPAHATRPHLMWSVWYQTAKNGCSDKMTTAFPHFPLPEMSLCLRQGTVSL